MPIICILADMSSKRYNTIKRRLGNITNMMLAQSLKELEAAGMVSRKQYNEVPPHVEYSLTELGQTLNIDVCVEGVEGPAQYRALHGTKVKYVQGYYFEKPLPRRAFEEKYVSR